MSEITSLNENKELKQKLHVLQERTGLYQCNTCQKAARYAFSQHGFCTRCQARICLECNINGKCIEHVTFCVLATRTSPWNPLVIFKTSDKKLAILNFENLDRCYGDTYQFAIKKEDELFYFNLEHEEGVDYFYTMEDLHDAVYTDKLVNVKNETIPISKIIRPFIPV